jgi:hypothetical protein
MKIDGLSREQAHAVVKREFWYYLSAMLMESWKKNARAEETRRRAFVAGEVALVRQRGGFVFALLRRHGRVLVARVEGEIVTVVRGIRRD